ncbi:MAG: hypothetical protein ACO20H_01445 [Bacteriovoracaceae bacterium]
MAFLYRPSVLVLKQNENLSKKAIKKMSKEGLSITEVDNIDKARDQLSLVNYDAVIVLEKKDKFFTEKELAPFLSYNVIIVGPDTSVSKSMEQISFLNPSELDTQLVDKIFSLIESKKLSVKAA